MHAAVQWYFRSSKASRARQWPPVWTVVELSVHLLDSTPQAAATAMLHR